jgi:KDO2-lipid IV(A) lauroyltransferase
MVPVFQERLADGTHHIRIAEPIEVTRETDPVELTARVTAAIEEYVRRVPEQWVWVHDRWRERPKWEVVLHSPGHEPIRTNTNLSLQR